MDFLKKLFGGGGGASSGDAKGIYYYVKPKGCEEVVRVRIDRNNDLSLSDDGKTYWVHKVAMGSKCFQRAEIDFYFSSSRQLSNTEVSGGDLVTQADYDAWLGSQQPEAP
ncbi:MAG: hypothetical protein ABI835_16520 [Chloroflexota bacterium]